MGNRLGELRLAEFISSDLRIRASINISLIQFIRDDTNLSPIFLVHLFALAVY
jgi:hypothetical protein